MKGAVGRPIPWHAVMGGSDLAGHNKYEGIKTDSPRGTVLGTLE